MLSEMETGIRTQVQNEICALAQQYGVSNVILFGSRARGDHQKKSDIDLAVVGGDSGMFSLDVKEKTSTLLMYDIVELSEYTSQELRTEINRDGRMLYEKV